MALSTRSAAGPPPAGVDQARTRLVPAWLRGGAAIGWRVLVTVALGAVLARLAIALSTAVLAVVVGTVIAATFSPLVRTLRARAWTQDDVPDAQIHERPEQRGSGIHRR